MPAAPQAYTLAPAPNVLHRFETQAASQGLQSPQVSAIFYLTLCRPAATPCTGTNQQWQLSGSQVEYESTRQQLSLHYRLLGWVCFNYALPFLNLSPFINHQTAEAFSGFEDSYMQKVQDRARLEY